jgi:L-threonylcarbamoyladenylate synthase
MENPALLERYVNDVPEIAYDLIELSDKPLTIIYDYAKNLARNLIAEDGSIGIRITTEKFSSELIRRFKRPIVSTSANISGKPSPTCFSEIEDEILEAVDYVVNYRQDETTKVAPSGIIKLGAGGQVKIIRP